MNKCKECGEENIHVCYPILIKNLSKNNDFRNLVKDIIIESKRNVYCSFCGKSNKEVEKMVAEGNFAICNECIDLCVDTLEADYIKREELDFLEAMKAMKKGYKIQFFQNEVWHDYDKNILSYTQNDLNARWRIKPDEKIS